MVWVGLVDFNFASLCGYPMKKTVGVNAAVERVSTVNGGRGRWGKWNTCIFVCVFIYTVFIRQWWGQATEGLLIYEGSALHWNIGTCKNYYFLPLE